MLMNDPESLYRTQRTQHALDIEDAAAARERHRRRREARREQARAARGDIVRGWASMRSLIRHVVAYATAPGPQARPHH
ncbi:hypothetical protein [uncultured Demequina sp.]|uniref:hypothetical protein n=1 Tax=uncultured Demequina sp. TaxID=693499 RepID=UPI0025DD6160|nr:hypothetical protein [uncultured Demequina sp.]